MSITFGCKGGGGDTNFGVTKTLVTIEVSPPNPSIALGTTRQLIATGIYSDNSNQNISTTVTWSSSSTAAATVSNTAGSNGIATAVAAGSSTITAALGGISGSTKLTVTTTPLVSIQVTPTNPSIGLGTTRQFTATGIFLDNTTQDMTASVTWSSKDTTVASVSSTAGSNGLATAFAAGSTVISATSGTISDSTTLTVTPATLSSIQIAPTNPSIAVGTTRQFTATGIMSDNTSQDLTASVTWSSSLEAVATVSNTAGSNGLATAVADGSTTITATLGGASGSSTLTVTTATLSSIQVTPTNPSLALGTTVPFTATGIYSNNSSQDLTASVVWSSSSTTVATISNAPGSSGQATAVAVGLATITATFGTVSGSTALTVTSATLVSIDVTPGLPSIALGTPQQFTATGTYSDSTTEDLTASVVWSSLSTTVATISNAPDSNGLATSVGAGLTTITASLAGVSGSTDLTVTSATLESIQVTSPDSSVPLKLTEQFSATGIYSDGSFEDLTQQATWISSNAEVAAISNAGLATPVSVGTTTITAWFGGISGSSTLTVTSATLTSITILPATAKIAIGTTQQFVATGNFNNGTTQDITASVVWTSPDSSVATISNTGSTNGLATAVSGGAVTITAALGLVTNTATLTITTVTLQSIAITPNNATIPLGSPVQFTATGTFSDMSTQDLTTQVTWKSAGRAVATISNAVGSQGLLTPLKAGATTISATVALAGGSSVTGSTGLTVSSSTLTSIVVTSASPSVNVGQTVQFTATGNYADGSTQNLTNSPSLTWSSSNRAIATIVNVPKKNKGLATGVSVGSVTISAKMKGFATPGTTTLTVNP